jgi:outer membrane protein
VKRLEVEIALALAGVTLGAGLAGARDLPDPFTPSSATSSFSTAPATSSPAPVRFSAASSIQSAVLAAGSVGSSAASSIPSTAPATASVATGASAGGEDPSSESSAADTLRLSVADAVRYALREGETAALAREDVKIAQARTGDVLSNALPKLNFDAGYDRNLKKPVIFFPDSTGESQSITIGEDNAYSATLSLRQPLYSSGRIGAAYKASKDRALAARYSGDAVARDVNLQVRQAYYGAVLARAQVQIAEESLTQAERRRDEIQARVDKGLAARFDLLRAEVEVAGRQPAVTRARNQASIALEGLKRAIGLPLDRPVALADTLRYTPFAMTREEAVQEALEKRDTLAAARMEASAAEHQADAQAANDLPLLYLDGNYSWQGQSSKKLIPGDHETAQSAAIGLSLTWPILDGWQNRSLTRQARAAARKATLAVHQLEESIRLEARSKWADLRATEQEIPAVEQAVQLAQEAYAIARVRYSSGLSTQLEVLDADLALTQAKISEKETLYRYEVALAELEHTLGRGPSLEPAGGDR